MTRRRSHRARKRSLGRLGRKVNRAARLGFHSVQFLRGGDMRIKSDMQEVFLQQDGLDEFLSGWAEHLKEREA